MRQLPVVCFAVLLFALMSAPSVLSASDDGFAEKIINSQCKNCHRFEGQPKSKFELKAPDLMWGGVKFQRGWLIRRLMGQEDNLYPNSYRWDKSTFSGKHMVLMKEEATAIVGYMEKTYRDPRVEKSFVDMSTFTAMEASLGAEIFREYSCMGCHQIKDDDGKK